MSLGKKTRKILIMVALLLLFLATYSLLYGHFTVSAPFIGAYDIESKSADAPSGTPEPSGNPGARDATSPAPLSNEYLSINTGPSGVSEGSLILVNQAHYYEIPDDSNLVSVADVKTASYRAADDEVTLDASIIGPLNDMMDAFYSETGRNNVTIISGFRGYTKQQEVLDGYIRTAGPAGALKWASAPGHSEHHTGLAFDLGLLSSGTVRTFTGTGVNAWFKENSWRYGFILRFPKDKTDITGITEEPWHFRYVGLPHSFIINQNNWCLEEYIEFIEKYSFDDPYKVMLDGDTYEIYYTPDTQLRIPFDCEFDYSGDNIGGFIVTIKY